MPYSMRQMHLFPKFHLAVFGAKSYFLQIECKGVEGGGVFFCLEMRQ